MKPVRIFHALRSRRVRDRVRVRVRVRAWVGVRVRVRVALTGRQSYVIAIE